MFVRYVSHFRIHRCFCTLIKLKQIKYLGYQKKAVVDETTAFFVFEWD